VLRWYKAASAMLLPTPPPPPPPLPGHHPLELDLCVILCELRLGHGGGGLLLAGALGQVQLSLEKLPCQNLLLPILALWRQITARGA